MSDQQKLWILKNQQGWQTDQPYLENIRRFGSGGAGMIERAKHVVGRFLGEITSPFE